MVPFAQQLDGLAFWLLMACWLNVSEKKLYGCRV
jgi:hypothetical protein